MQTFGLTWSEHHPSWAQKTWNDGNVTTLFPLENQDLYDRASRICPRHVGQLRSDILRYEILYRFGGMYVDADFEAYRAFDPLVRGLACFATFEEQDVWVANGLMGAVPGHPFVGRLITGLGASVRRNLGDRPSIVSGPKYLTAMWRQDPRQMEVLPQHLFYPYPHTDVHLHPIGERIEDASLYAVHHWHNKRRERNLLPHDAEA